MPSRLTLLKPRFWLVAVACAILGWSAAASRAAVGWNPNGSCFVDSPDLLVTVFPSSGSMTVYDKASGQTWNQRAASSHTAFSNVTLFTNVNAIGFNTSFYPTNGGTIATWVELWLSGRKLSVTANVDDYATPLTSFNFIEPFQPASGMSVVVPEFTDGKIYPCNLSSWVNYNLDSIRALNLTIPWVAIVNLTSGAGYSLTYDTPNDAQLKLARYGGLRSPLVAWNGQKGTFGYKRSITYNFTAAGGYVELARMYRTNAMAQGWIVPFSLKAQTRPAITNLYGAVLLWDMLDNMSDKELRAMGVAKAVHHADWGNARARLDVANAMGFVTEEYDYYEAGILGTTPQAYEYWHILTNQCVKDVSSNITYLGTWGERCPATYVSAGQSIIPQRLAAMPLKSRYIDQMTQNILGHDTGPRGGGSTDECWDPNHPQTRTDWVNNCKNFYQYVAGTLGQITGAELGKSYQVPWTELFYGMGSSWEPWGEDMFPNFYGDYSDTTTYDRYVAWGLNPALRVPIWELIFHDGTIAPLYPWDGNDTCYKLTNNDAVFQGMKDCQSVLYGTPALFLCRDDGETSFSWPVSDVTHTNRLRWLQSYRNTCKVHEALADKGMLSHRFVTTDRLVQQTDWSDGTKIIVNYGTNDYFADVGYPYSQLLRQNCFTVKGPWGGAMRSYYYGPARIVTYLWKDDYHFDDEQLSSGKPVALSHWRTATNNIRVNVDYIPGNTNVSFVISPLLVQSTWDFSTTHVYQCDPTNGSRLRELSWTNSGNAGIQVGGLSGWIVLDVVCGQSFGAYESLIISHQPLAFYSLSGDSADPTTAHSFGTLGGVDGTIVGAGTASGLLPATLTARHFNGSNTFVSLGNPPALNFTGQITLEAWIKPSATQNSGLANVISHGVNDAGNAEVMLRLTDVGLASARYQVGSWNGIESGVSWPVPVGDYGSWVHLAGTYDGVRWKLFRNGAQVASLVKTVGSVLVNNADWAIGARGAGDARFFTGDIASVAIYNSALSPTAIQSHYYVGVNGLPQLTISLTGGNVSLTWPAGTLQNADFIAGPYTDLATVSPYSTSPIAGQKFFRLRL